MRRVTFLLMLIAGGSALCQSNREPPLAGATQINREPSLPIHLVPVAPPSFKLLTQPAVQTEIALTARQKQTVEELSGAWMIRAQTWEFGSLGLITPEMARAIVIQRTKDFLESGLIKEQRTRLEQILFQLREREFGAHAAFAMSARELGLRDDQVEDVSNIKGLRVEEITKHVTSGDRFEMIKNRVTATNGETFERMSEMLTRGQRERLKQMRGTPFVGKVDWSGVTATKQDAPRASKVPLPKPDRQDQGFRLLVQKFPASCFGLYDFELYYLATPEVRKELNISEEQAKQLDDRVAAWAAEWQRSSGTHFDRASRLHNQTAKAIEEALKADQKKRLGQIMMRRRLLVSPEAMCGHPAAVATLKLSPFQLKGLSEGQSLDEVLTEGQAAAVKDIAGEPFDIPKDIADPLLTFQPAAGAIAPPAKPAIARAFLIISDRLKLADKQIARLRELAEDEPKIMELIQKELDFADTPPVIGATRSLTSANAVAGRFKAAIEEQCWNVLDAQQQSTARRIFGVKR